MSNRDAVLRAMRNDPLKAEEIRHAAGLSHEEVYMELVALESAGLAYVDTLGYEPRKAERRPWTLTKRGYLAACEVAA